MFIARFRGSMSAAFVLAAVAGTAAATSGSASISGVESASEQVAQSAEVFVEIPGVQEFSGQVIARPLQFETLADEGLNQGQIEDVIRRSKLQLAQFEEVWYEPLVDHHVIRTPAGMTDNEFIAQLTATGLYEFVEPDWILYPIGCPNDTRFNNQWHHGSNRMQSCLAWDIHTGSPATTIGTCDTGVDFNHSDLQSHRKEGYNAVNRVWENNGGQINDVNGHGTHVTGCSGANGNNNNGVSGVGWNFSHRMMRVSNSSGGSANLSTLTHAALTSIQAGDKVANVSYSGVTSSSVRSTATSIKNLGGLLCWAAGNDGRRLNWGDRDNDDVIVVGSSTSSDNKSGFSAFGPSVDLVAPGSSILSTTRGGGYANFSGTSMASPVAAGVIALIWDYNPSLTPDDVEDILKQGADDLGASGPDETFGWGRVNSYESLLLAGGTPNEPPVITINSPTNGGQYTLGSQVQFNSTTIDPEDGDISDQVTWTSTRDGFLGTGNFSTSSLSEGLHFIDVEVTDSNGASDFELISIDIVPGGGGVPDAPINIGSGERPRNEVTFEWSDESNNEDGFEVQRMEWNGSGWANRQTAGTTGANATTFSENVGGVHTRYRVRAFNSDGDSSWSQWSPTRPNKAGNIQDNVNGNDVQITWRDNSGIETGFIILRQEKAPFWNANTNTVIATLPPNTTSFDYTAPSGTFRFRVIAITDTVQSLPTGWTRGITFP